MRTGLHTISYAGVWPGQARLSLSEIIQRAGKLGYDGLMIAAKRPHLSVLDADSDTLTRLREEMDAAGVGLACMAGYNNFSGDAEHADIPFGEMQVAYIVELARIAKALGGSIVRVFTGYTHPALSEWALRGKIVTCLKEAAQRASAFGCTLAVQNHHDCGAHWQTLGDLITEIAEPNCKAGFDAWAPTLHGDDIVAAASAMAPITCQTVIADYIRRPRFQYMPQFVNYERQPDLVQAVPVGEGIIDYRGFIKALRDGGFDGHVTYEMCSPLRGGGELENLDYCAGRFLDFMRGL